MTNYAIVGVSTYDGRKLELRRDTNINTPPLDMSEKVRIKESDLATLFAVAESRVRDCEHENQSPDGSAATFLFFRCIDCGTDIQEAR